MAAHNSCSLLMLLVQCIPGAEFDQQIDAVQII